MCLLILQQCNEVHGLDIGRNFGDEGLFFLAESLGYNQVRASVYLL